MPSVHCNNVVNTHFILRRQEYAVVADGNLSAEATPTTEAHTQNLANKPLPSDLVLLEGLEL